VCCRSETGNCTLTGEAVKKKRHTKTERITPKRAQELLATMRRNRPVRRKVVEGYVEEMQAGRWRSTGQGIAIDWDGHLMDGQHRLLAIIESGIAVEMDVTYNEDPDNFKVRDKHRRRTIADDLSLADVQYPNESARIYRLWLDLQYTKPDRYVAFGKQNRFGWNSEKALEWVQENEEDLAHVIERCRRADAKRALYPPSLMQMLYFCFYQTDPNAADAFMEDLICGCEGAGPVPKLREALDQLLLEKVRGMRPPQYLFAALVIKAWNAVREKKRPRTIAFGPKELFPAVEE